jgi:hypothetical protein
MYESRNIGLKIFSLDSKSTILTYPFINFVTPLPGFWFINDYDRFVGMTTSDTFLIYNTTYTSHKFY